MISFPHALDLAVLVIACGWVITSYVHRRTSPFWKLQRRLGNGGEAIQFAITLQESAGDHDAMLFLNDWLHGDLTDWPDFNAEEVRK
jgi:hypothetical protein